MSTFAYEMPVKYMTLVPGVDFSNSRYCFATVTADGTGALAAAGAPVVGVIQEPNSVNQPTEVMFSGISYIMYGGTVANGAAVEVGANGQAVTHNTGTIAGIAIVGGNAGDIGCILLK